MGSSFSRKPSAEQDAASSAPGFTRKFQVSHSFPSRSRANAPGATPGAWSRHLGVFVPPVPCGKPPRCQRGACQCLAAGPSRKLVGLKHTSTSRLEHQAGPPGSCRPPPQQRGLVSHGWHNPRDAIAHRGSPSPFTITIPSPIGATQAVPRCFLCTASRCYPPYEGFSAWEEHPPGAGVGATGR